MRQIVVGGLFRISGERNDMHDSGENGHVYRVSETKILHCLSSHFTNKPWHHYNLRRREMGLTMLNEYDFQCRLDAAMVRVCHAVRSLLIEQTKKVE